MHFLLSIALVLQIISAVVVIVLVLMQHGKESRVIRSEERRSEANDSRKENRLL